MISQQRHVDAWIIYFLCQFLIVNLVKGVDHCRLDQFRCLDGSQCIRLEYRCDAEDDCEDSSDEAGCAQSQDVILDNFLLVSIIREDDNSSTVQPQVYKIDVATGHSKHLFATHPRTPASLAIDHRRKVLYYVDRSVELIGSVSIDHPSNSTKVVFRDPTLDADLEGIAIDTTTQKLYYCDGGSSPKIAEIDLTNDDKTRRTIYTRTNVKPKGIVVDEANSELYWTDWGTNPGIYVIGLEPNARRKSLVTHDIVIPNALAIDFREEVMFWIDAHLDRIEMAKLNGQDRVQLLREPGDPHYYALTISPQFLYIADWTRHYVLKFDRQRNTSSSQHPVLRGKKTGIAFYSSSFNNTGRRRRDRFNITTITPTPTSYPDRMSAIDKDKWTKGKEQMETQKSKKNTDLNVGIIVAIAVVFIILIIPVITGLLCYIRRRHQQVVSNGTLATSVNLSTVIASERQPDTEYLYSPYVTGLNNYAPLTDSDQNYYATVPPTKDDSYLMPMDDVYDN